MKTTHQRLSRYIRDFKYSQHQCSGCGNELSRVRLLLDGKLITHKDIIRMDFQVSPEEWLNVQIRLQPVCRFCSTVSTGSPARLFDIHGFKQRLLEDNSLCLATVREYVMRMRRLDQALSGQGMTAAQLPAFSAQEQWEQLLPEKTRINYRIALAKYASYYPEQIYFAPLNR